MNEMASSFSARPRILVAIASYGSGNDHYLKQLIDEYRSMSFDIDIVIMSNLDKTPAPAIEMIVGLPNKNPWSLPFLHKKLFAERIEQYDLFVYSEDDMLVTERNLSAFLEVSSSLREDEVAGFLRIERGANSRVNFPEVHGHFHWDPASIRQRGDYTLAKFTNEHAAVYVLTRDQLKRALRSGGFLVEPHEERKYDLLCAAATDPYTQCGFEKLIPVSHLDDFTIRHLSGRYVGQLGVEAAEIAGQVSTMLKLAEEERRPAPLFNTESKLWRGKYSKNYYDPVAEEIVSMIPPNVRSVLSIGCGSGATESYLIKKGVQVVAVPLDPIVSSNATKLGVEVVSGNFHDVKAKLKGREFDCIMYLNVLHLVPNPVEILSLFRDCLSPEAIVIIQTPNMLGVPAVWSSIRFSPRLQLFGSFETTGVHRTSFRTIRDWCRKSGLTVDKTVGMIRLRTDIFRAITPDFIARALAPALIAVAQRK